MMISIVLVVALRSQTTFLQTTVATAHKVQVAVALKRLFCTAKKEETLAVPAAKLSYSVTEVKEQKQFKDLEGLKRIKVAAKWSEAGHEDELAFVMFAYEPTQEKEKEKKA